MPMITQVGQAQQVLRDIAWYKSEWTKANAHYLLGEYSRNQVKLNISTNRPSHNLVIFSTLQDTTSLIQAMIILPKLILP